MVNPRFITVDLDKPAGSRLPNVVTAELKSSAVNDIAYAYQPMTLTNDSIWVTELWVDATDRAYDLTLDFGIIVFGAMTAGATTGIEFFIRDAANSQSLVYNIFTSPPAASNGFASAKPPAMRTRIPKGRGLARYVAVVAGNNTNTAAVPVLINPTWAPVHTSFVSLRAEAV